MGFVKHAIWENLPSGGESWPPNPDSSVPCCSQEVLECVCALMCECVCVHTFPRKPVLYAFPAVADLKDLTVFVTMMNKSKVFEEKKKFILIFQDKSAATPETSPSFSPHVRCSELRIHVLFVVTEKCLSL